MIINDDGDSSFSQNFYLTLAVLRYHFFNFDTISIRFTKYRDIDVDVDIK